MALLTPKALTSFSGRRQEEDATMSQQQTGRLHTPESKSRQDCLASKESCNNSPTWSLEAAESKLNTVKRIEKNSLAIYTLSGRKKQLTSSKIPSKQIPLPTPVDHMNLFQFDEE